MVEGPVSKRRFSRRVVRQATIIGVVAVLVLVLGVVGWNMYSSGKQSNLESTNQQLDTDAKSHARQISEFFNKISTALTAYAGDDRIKTLFASADTAQLSTEAEAAGTQFPAALKVRLLLPGQYEPDSASNPPLSYGSIDMLNKAEKTTGPIAADAFLFGSETQHIVMIERAKNTSGQLIGLVHLSLKVDLMNQALASLQATNGYMEIRQTSSGKSLVLGQTGEPALKDGEPITTSIAGTLWTLAYWGQVGDVSPQTSETSSGMGLPLIAIVLLLVLVAAVVVLKLKKQQGNDALPSTNHEISYQGAILAIMEGAHPGMEKLISNFPKRTGVSKVEPKISEGLSGEDVTRIATKEPAKAAPVQATNKPTPAAAKPATPPVSKPAPAAEKEIDAASLPAVIFRKYDIRGVVGKTLTPEIVSKIGQAIGSMADEAGQKNIIVGRDGRLSGPELMDSLIKGLRAAGRNVIDVGVVPTPVLYFATNHIKGSNSGVMLTGSHNGPEFNGLKIVINNNTLSEEGIQELYNRIVNNNLVTGTGSLGTAEIIPDYIRRITEEIPVAFGKSFKLVVDAGNGVGGIVAPQLYRALGHDVIEMYCELDGRFPNHHPDPGQPENMQALIARVREEKADLGFAFDGDADRLGVVDGKGNIIWPDRQLMVFARDVLSRNQGATIIYDVKCTSHLRKVIEASGGKAVMWKTGHSLIKSKMKELHAPLAGEMSGHIFFKERWYGFDDALYSGARMLEILLKSTSSPEEFFAEIPESVSTPELKIDMPESEHIAFMQKLESKLTFKDTEVITVDGFRVEFKDGWGLIRPSNTTPCLVVRFEADNQPALERIQSSFRDVLKSINPDLKIPF